MPDTLNLAPPSELLLRPATPQDLPQLLAIENACFTPEEAATAAAFALRLQRIPDSFWVSFMFPVTVRAEKHWSTAKSALNAEPGSATDPQKKGA
jgi:hypothetical protein